MELVTVRIPKNLVESVKSLYDSESVSTRSFIITMLLSNVPEGKVDLLANEMKANTREIQRLKNQRSAILNSNSKPKENKRLERMLKQSEFTNQMMLSYIKLMLSDTGYAFPDNIEERLNSFDDYDRGLKQHIVKKFEE